MCMGLALRRACIAGGTEGVQSVQVTRHECVRVILHGQSELEASNVVLIGSHTFEVILPIFRPQNLPSI